jgi:serine/threonine protein kinase
MWGQLRANRVHGPLRNNGPPFSVFSRYLETCYQVALGLEHMHAKKVVHLALKESNILLGGDGQVVIADFDLSAREGAKLQLARGTPGYTAPRSCRRVAKGAQDQGAVHGPQWTCTA